MEKSWAVRDARRKAARLKRTVTHRKKNVKKGTRWEGLSYQIAESAKTLAQVKKGEGEGAHRLLVNNLEITDPKTYSLRLSLVWGHSARIPPFSSISPQRAILLCISLLNKTIYYFNLPLRVLILILWCLRPRTPVTRHQNPTSVSPDYLWR